MQRDKARLSVSATAVSLLFLFCTHALAQERDFSRDLNRNELREAPKAPGHVGIVRDWSNHHVLYPLVGPVKTMIKLQNDPRAVQSWQDLYRQDWRRSREPHPRRAPQAGLHKDWSINLGGPMAAGMYPAKYTFYPTASPSCTNDFIAFPVDVSGSASQPNIVGFNNLYSGSAGGTGLCSGRTVQGGTTDDTNSATVTWSYYLNPDAQLNLSPVNFAATSPALSTDGTKVALVISDPNLGVSYFVVLAPHAGDGVAADLQTVTSPVQITSFSSNAVTAGSGTASSLTFLNNSDTNSSPFIDYVNDAAYFGDDAGDLYHVLDVFCTTPACIGGTLAPNADSTWGGTLGVPTGCLGELTGPVVDSFGNVFVGCPDGNVYGFASSSAPLTGSPIAVGDGSSTGGIVDPPVVDIVNGYLYVVTGSSNSLGGLSVVAQIQDTGTAMSLVRTAALGSAGNFNLHAPAFNNAYFTAPFDGSVANVQGTTTSNTTTGNTSNWQIYEWAVQSDSTNCPSLPNLCATLYGVGFDNSSHLMTAGAASNFLEIASSIGSEFSPVTEFLNTGTSTEAIFASGQTSTTPNLLLYNVSDFAGLFPNVAYPQNSTNAAGGSASEAGGTTGMVVDNDGSASEQESSIYFGVPSASTAVKLTQSGLE